MSPAAVETPLHVFRFRVEFFTSAEDGGAGGGGTGGGEPVPLCDAAFAECSGLEATMEAKTINVGGRNFGPVQRAGRTSFATVILKRGVTHSTHLWQWFELVSGGAYAYRLDAEISLLPNHGDAAALTWSIPTNRADSACA